VARNVLVKATVGIVALGVLGVLFVRSARSTRAEAYEVTRDRLSRWTLAVEPPRGPSGAVLVLRSDEELARELFNQVFLRSGESMRGPSPAAMPLVLQDEFDAAISGTLTPDVLLEIAKASGLETPSFASQCMAYRRVSQPGSTRQIYFVRYEWPAFAAFRTKVAERLATAGGRSAFQPAALTPLLIVAASDAAFSRWLPLQKGETDDCLAPVVVR